jgi:NAD(P)-dependent dehydrogenase (short-subunit alcohol dehydrogenase family)
LKRILRFDFTNKFDHKNKLKLMEKKFEEKVALVTGESSGIGLATAKELISRGAKVIITGRHKGSVENAAKQIGAMGIVSDQADMNQINELVKQTMHHFGKLDILFINAGIASFSPIDTISEEEFNGIININLKGALFTLQRFIPLLNDYASVVLLSSINAYNRMPNTAAYAASKAALNAVAKVAAIELAPRGIRVNTVVPGPVDTPLWGKVGLSEEQQNAVVSLIQGKVPLRRFGTSGEIAKAVAFLSSDHSSFTTGAELVVDGGFNLNTLVG